MRQNQEVECPRCGEADRRSLGMNVCGLCECEFFVEPKRCVCNDGQDRPYWKCPVHGDVLVHQ